MDLGQQSLTLYACYFDCGMYYAYRLLRHDPVHLVENTRLLEEYIISYSTLNRGQYFSLKHRQFFFRISWRHIEDKSSIQYLRCFVDDSSWGRCLIIIVCCGNGPFTAQDTPFVAAPASSFWLE